MSSILASCCMALTACQGLPSCSGLTAQSNCLCVSAELLAGWTEEGEISLMDSSSTECPRPC
mgnify:CR=1 FL=1